MLDTEFHGGIFRLDDEPDDSEPPADSEIPHNREAEEAVLGAVLIDEGCFYKASSLISGGDFYIVRHRWIWDAYQRLKDSKTPIDILTVSDELDRHEKLADAGGTSFLTSLLNQVPTTLHVEHYAEIVRQEAVRRKVLEHASTAASLAYDHKKAISEVVGGVMGGAQDVARKTLSVGKQSGVSDAAKSFDSSLMEISKTGKLPGVPTGLIELNTLLGGGYHDGDLYLVGGRPGWGKTALLIYSALEAAQEGKRVVIFSLEMSREQLVSRMMAQLCKIDTQRMRFGQLQENEWPIYTEKIDFLSGLNIQINDTAGASINYIEAQCEILAAETKLDAVFVDYLSLVNTPGQRFTKESDRINYLAKYLKNMARELNLPVIAAHQMNRNIERDGGVPNMSDLREGGEADPDVIMFVHPSTETNEANIRVVSIAKHRNGPLGEVRALFNEKYTSFENARKVVYKTTEEKWYDKQ